jgi:hypothetical protein
MDLLKEQDVINLICKVVNAGGKPVKIIVSKAEIKAQFAYFTNSTYGSNGVIYAGPITGPLEIEVDPMVKDTDIMVLSE